jgi:hypothetical protein
MSTETGDSAVAGPTLRVVSGQPTPEELAALVVVLAARSGSGAAGEAQAPRSSSAWTDRSRYVRTNRLGYGSQTGWRASALPR